MSKAFEILSDALEEAIDDAKTDSPKLKNQTLTLTVEEDSEITPLSSSDETGAKSA